MQVSVSPLPLIKRFPLTISRGSSAGSENLLIAVTSSGITGLGEMSPVSIGDEPETAGTARADIDRWTAALSAIEPWEMQKVEVALEELGGGRAARAGLDIALHDWLGNRAGVPLYELLGGDCGSIAQTSLTVGINPPDVVRERIPELMARLNPRILKVKLGNPAGLDADQEMFEVVREVTPAGIALRVDANGGWSVDGARRMAAWLADRGVEYLEQPLPRGQEADLPHVHHNCPLPLFADESCRVASDVPALADRVDGINLKLMKSGGIREGLRVIHTARAHGLKMMIGCMSESSLSIAAGAHLSSLVDYVDLDSHLNQHPDPFTGLEWSGGRVLPSNVPGLGVQRRPVAAAMSDG